MARRLVLRLGVIGVVRAAVESCATSGGVLFHLIGLACKQTKESTKHHGTTASQHHGTSRQQKNRTGGRKEVRARVRVAWPQAKKQKQHHKK